MPDFTKLAEQYIATWNETDPSVRRALIGRAVVARTAGTSTRWPTRRGPDQIDAVISAAQAQFGGMTFRLASAVDAHHDQARFGWELGPAGAGAVVAGFDVAQLDGDGRLALVLGFLDQVPSA